MVSDEVRPFLKWVGGKGQLLSKIERYYPFGDGKITKYIEPFVGGGAVLFDILNKYELEAVYINDSNTELINAYCVVRNNVDKLIELLMTMQNEFLPMNMDGRKVYYTNRRNQYNSLITNSGFNNTLKAALMIFLNRTCFNALYRVNSKGLFNVSMGTYRNPTICDEDNLRAVSEKLQGITVLCGDYHNTVDFIDSKTFVYLDPPYRAISNTSNFTRYTKDWNGDKSQIVLSEFIDDINAEGALVLMSNSDPKNTDVEDNFFDTLYSSYNIKRVEAKRSINCKADGRGAVKELLISNF